MNVVFVKVLDLQLDILVMVIALEAMVQAQDVAVQTSLLQTGILEHYMRMNVITKAL